MKKLEKYSVSMKIFIVGFIFAGILVVHFVLFLWATLMYNSMLTPENVENMLEFVIYIYSFFALNFFIENYKKTFLIFGAVNLSGFVVLLSYGFYSQCYSLPSYTDPEEWCLNYEEHLEAQRLQREENEKELMRFIEEDFDDFLEEEWAKGRPDEILEVDEGAEPVMDKLLFIEPKTMLEYYNAIPDKYVFSPVGNINKKGNVTTRNDFIEILDEENYYMLLNNNAANVRQGGGISYIEITLFLSSDAPDTLAIIDNVCVTIGCIVNDLYLLQIHDGEWVDVKEDIFPSYEALDADFIVRKVRSARLAKFGDVEESPENLPNVMYTLPRYGTTILLKEEKTDINIYGFSWDGQKFVSEKF